MRKTLNAREDLLPSLAEVFREHGFEGASLARIGRATGLGKGSLYHFFPGGKTEMAATVLAQIDAWFETQVFIPLRSAPDPERAVGAMVELLERYFRSGRRVCLIGLFALGEVRDTFTRSVSDYFRRWIEALAAVLTRGGLAPTAAGELAEEFVTTIQGAIVLTRALDDPKVFERACARVRDRVRLMRH